MRARYFLQRTEKGPATSVPAGSFPCLVGDCSIAGSCKDTRPPRPLPLGKKEISRSLGGCWIGEDKAIMGRDRGHTSGYLLHAVQHQSQLSLWQAWDATSVATDYGVTYQNTWA